MNFAEYAHVSNDYFHILAWILLFPNLVFLSLCFSDYLHIENLFFFLLSSLGVIGHNGYNSCLKCTTEGEYSHIFRTMIFPDTNAPLRNDGDFRARVYEGHHKQDSILESIVGLDMVKDFPIGDALHLIDLGITKRFLTGWKTGSLNNHNAKWSAHQIDAVSTFLQSCKLPREFQRPVRSLEHLSRWKGTEFRTFLLYLSPIVTRKFFDTEEISDHFMNFFCAVQICSRHDQTPENYEIAKNLIHDFLEGTKSLYGSQMFCSNMHNLTHLIDDVKRYGPLDTFDAYPFESRLFGLKRLIRSGNLPLAQVSRRICEIQSNSGVEQQSYSKFKNPILKRKHAMARSDIYKANSSVVNGEADIYSFVDFGNFCINTESESDRWVLTDNCDIVYVKHIIHNRTLDTIELHGQKLRDIYDFFCKPVASSLLYIFASNLELNEIQCFSSEQLLCKMVKIDCHDIKLPKTVFFPLIHCLFNDFD